MYTHRDATEPPVEDVHELLRRFCRTQTRRGAIMTMLRVERGRTDRELWLKWIIACSVGVAIGEAIGAAVPETSILLGGVHSAVIGAVLGLMQWLVLRSRVGWAGWWPVASSIGLGV